MNNQMNGAYNGIGNGTGIIIIDYSCCSDWHCVIIWTFWLRNQISTKPNRSHSSSFCSVFAQFFSISHSRCSILHPASSDSANEPAANLIYLFAPTNQLGQLPPADYWANRATNSAYRTVRRCWVSSRSDQFALFEAYKRLRSEQFAPPRVKAISR